MKKNDDESIEMFYGFWKYLGVIGIFLTGVALTWWGVNIISNDWVAIRTAIGPLGNAVLAPFAIGIILSLMGAVEFLKMIRKT